MKDIIEKIKKLRELATSNNIHEATAAAVAADKLISKFRISEQDISDHSSEEVEEDTVFLYESARAITWKYSLACILANHYSCYLYNKTGISDNFRRVTRLRLSGVKSDMEITKYMFTWLVFEIERLNKANKGKGHIACNSFCVGAVHGIREQLNKSKAEMKQDAVDNNQSTAIQKLDQRSIAAEALIKSKNNILPNNKKLVSRVDQDYYNDGVNAGKNLHLGKVMTGVGNKLLGS